MVDQEISQHRAAEGSDERCHHRVSQGRAPLSQNRKCERFWTLPSPFLTLAQKLDALDHEPALVLRERDPATGGYISRPPMIPAICVIGWPRITDVHARQRSPAIGRRLHKKSIFCTSLNGALCAKPGGSGRFT